MAVANYHSDFRDILKQPFWGTSVKKAVESGSDIVVTGSSKLLPVFKAKVYKNLKLWNQYKKK